MATERSPRRPTAEELDEKLSVPLKPDEFVEAILQVKAVDEDSEEDSES
jgi:hypothetical protein